jgi:hypothetical protein
MALYALHLAVGETGLVVGQAVMVACLGLLLLALGRLPGQGWAAPTFAAALAVLACGLRLHLSPGLVSALLLAVCLWFVRPREGGGGHSLPWALFALFVLWVNVDAWFVVGLAVVAAIDLGRALDARRGVEQPQAPALGLAGFGLLLAVCLLNPRHVLAFAPPREWSWLSPFTPAYFTYVGINPASFAFFVLLGLGLVSFWANRSGWRWERFLPWLLLAVIACLEARAVPFFAVLGGPVLSLNLQEAAGRQEGTAGAVRGTLVVAVAAALLACAWPGWLQAPPYEPRRWNFELPQAPRRAAEHLAAGPFPAGARALHLSDETAYAFAWFAPEVPGQMDEELAKGIRGERDAPSDWRARMSEKNIACIVASGQAAGRLPLGEPRWPLLFLEGDVVVFGWSGWAERPWPSLDIHRMAFSPAVEKQAPEGGPGEPAERAWWEAFWRPAPLFSEARHEARQFADWAERFRQQAPQRNNVAWRASQVRGLAGAEGLLGVPGLPCVGPHRAGLAFIMARLPIQEVEESSPALLFLAIRAARRAIKQAPDDPEAHLVLGEAYLRLLYTTRERGWAQRLPELGQLRLAQAANALNRAVTLRPGLAGAHRNLAEVYRSLGYLDLAAHHLRAYLELVRAMAPADAAVAKQHRAEVQRVEEELRPLEAKVSKARDEYAKQSAGKRVLARAALAQEKGLAGLARDLLLESDVGAFGKEGLALELELLLGTGRAVNVRDWASPEQRGVLGVAYHWLRAQALAALGQYGEAQTECVGLGFSLGDEHRLGGRQASWTAWNTPADAIATLVAELVTRVQGPVRVMRRQADVRVLHGLLALEQGRPEEAASDFRTALRVWRGGLDFRGRPLAEGYLALIEADE